MATIGTFPSADDGLTGSIRTLLVNTRAAFRATEPGSGDKAPTTVC